MAFPLIQLRNFVSVAENYIDELPETDYRGAFFRFEQISSQSLVWYHALLSNIDISGSLSDHRNATEENAYNLYQKLMSSWKLATLDIVMSSKYKTILFPPESASTILSQSLEQIKTRRTYVKMSIFSVKKKQLIKDRQLIVPLESCFEEIFQEQFCFEPTPLMIFSSNEKIDRNRNDINALIQAFQSEIHDPIAPSVSLLYILLEKALLKINTSCNQSANSKTRLIDLNVRLQMPYSLKHCDFCDHFLIFESIFDDHPINDCEEKNVLVSRKERTQICQICEGDLALWTVRDSDMSIESPAKFCTECLTKAFYDKEGKLKEEKLSFYRIFNQTINY